MNLIEKRKRILDISTELEVLLNDKNISLEISKLDKDIANYLHLLEVDGLNSAQISKITKGLRETLTKRRNVKGLATLIQGTGNGMSLTNYFKSVKINLRPEIEIKECIRKDYYDLLKEVLSK